MNSLLTTITVVMVLLVASQSPAMFAHGAACGAYATFGPDPLLAMEEHTITVANAAQENGVVYHGNSDGTCLDGLSEFSNGGSTVTITTEQQLTMFRASENYHMCQGGSDLCTVSRVMPVLNTRNGMWKPVAAPPTACHLVIPSPPASAPFMMSLFGGTTPFSTLRGSMGYTMDVGISIHRNCTTRNEEVLDGSITWGVSAMINFAGVPTGFYTPCLRIWKAGSIVVDWLSVNALLGDATHNLAVGGVVSTNWAWYCEGIGTTYLQFGAQVTIYIDLAVLSDGFTHFAVDASADVCSPSVQNDFVIGDLSAFDATYASGTITVSRPYGSPAGGVGVLCAARGATEPWVRVTYTASAAFHFCDAQRGLWLSSGDRNTCIDCGPNSSMPCHNNGDCHTTHETKTYFLLTQTCSCYNRFYGTECEYYDLDTPTFSQAPGTYQGKVEVSVIASSPTDYVKVTYSDATTADCLGQCDLVLREGTTLTAYSYHTNGSKSQTDLVGVFNVITATASASLCPGTFVGSNVAMRSSDWTVTFADSTSYPEVTLHGNSDLSCSDAYPLAASGNTITVTQDDEWMRFHGSEKYHLCSNGEMLCTAPRLVPFQTILAGSWRPLVITQPMAYSTNVGTPFSLFLFTGTTDFSALRATGWAFDFAMSLHRNCTTQVETVLDATVTWIPGSGAFVFFTAKPLAIYALCFRVYYGGSVVADWHPYSAVLRHASMNMAMGISLSLTLTWGVTSTGSSATIRYGQTINVFIPNAVQALGVTHFGIDTGAHICSTFLDPSFTLSDLAVHNATHYTATTTVNRPYGSPGGGSGVLCGSYGVDQPWMILSESFGDVFFYCETHGGVWKSDLNTCVYCSPSESIPMCNGNGACNLVREDKTQLLQQLDACVCDSRYYGTYCEYYELDVPVFSHANDSYIARPLEVTVTTTNPGTEGIHLTFDNGTTYACNSPCVLRLYEDATISAYAFRADGSASGTVGYTYVVLTPTPTETITVTPAPTSTAEETMTKSAVPTLTQEATKTPDRTITGANVVPTATQTSELTPSHTEPLKATVTPTPIPTTMVPVTSVPTPADGPPILSSSTTSVQVGDFWSFNYTSVSSLTIQCGWFTQGYAVLEQRLVSEIGSPTEAETMVPSFNPSAVCPRVVITGCQSSGSCTSLTVPITTPMGQGALHVSPKLVVGGTNAALFSVNVSGYSRLLMGPFGVRMNNATSAVAPQSRTVNCTHVRTKPQIWQALELLLQTATSREEFLFVWASYNNTATILDFVTDFCSTDGLRVCEPSEFFVQGEPLLLAAPTLDFITATPSWWDAGYFACNVSSGFVSGHLATTEGNYCDCSVSVESCLCPANSSSVGVFVTVEGSQHVVQGPTASLQLQVPPLEIITTRVNFTVETVVTSPAAHVQMLVSAVSPPVVVTVNGTSCNQSGTECQNSNFAVDGTPFVVNVTAPSYYVGNLTVRVEASANSLTKVNFLSVDFSSQVVASPGGNSAGIFTSTAADCAGVAVAGSLVCLLFGIAFVLRLVQMFWAQRKGAARLIRTSGRALLMSHKWYSVLSCCHSTCGCKHVANLAKDVALAWGILTWFVGDATTGAQYPIPITTILICTFLFGVLRVVMSFLFAVQEPSASDREAAKKAAELTIDAAPLKSSNYSISHLVGLGEKERPFESSEESKLEETMTKLGYATCAVVTAIGVGLSVTGQVCTGFGEMLSTMFAIDIIVVETGFVGLTALYRWMCYEENFKYVHPE